jgi:hypothetical protein
VIVCKSPAKSVGQRKSDRFIEGINQLPTFSHLPL